MTVGDGCQPLPAPLPDRDRGGPHMGLQSRVGEGGDGGTPGPGFVLWLTVLPATPTHETSSRVYVPWGEILHHLILQFPVEFRV